MDRTDTVRSGWRSIGPRLADDAEHILFTHDQVLLVLDLHLGAGVLAEQDPVAGLDIQGDLLAVVVHLAVPDGDHLALLGLLLGRVGDDYSPLLHLTLLDALDKDAIVQWTNLHGQLASR